LFCALQTLYAHLCIDSPTPLHLQHTPPHHNTGPPLAPHDALQGAAQGQALGVKKARQPFGRLPPLSRARRGCGACALFFATSRSLHSLSANISPPPFSLFSALFCLRRGAHGGPGACAPLFTRPCIANPRVGKGCLHASVCKGGKALRAFRYNIFPQILPTKKTKRALHAMPKSVISAGTKPYTFTQPKKGCPPTPLSPHTAPLRSPCPLSMFPRACVDPVVLC
jgi:hypothetical protein